MKLKICVSDRCFFPKSGFMSSKAVVELAKSLGYKQVEFHPTWAVWWEVLMRGKLNCQPEDISSFHISWREDGRNVGLGFFNNLFNPDYRVFPPEILGTKVIQQLEKMYKKPVVTHWQEDFIKFKSPILELNAFFGMNRAQIEKEIKRGRVKGVAIDTDKFTDWLEEVGEKENETLARFFPYVKEIHFRFGYKEDFKLLSSGRETKSARVVKKLVKRGYKGRVVVEMGWPEPGSIKVLRREGLEKVHRSIIEFLRNL